jgi:hypothetical protein
MPDRDPTTREKVRGVIVHKAGSKYQHTPDAKFFLQVNFLDDDFCFGVFS